MDDNAVEFMGGVINTEHAKEYFQNSSVSQIVFRQNKDYFFDLSVSTGH